MSNPRLASTMKPLTRRATAGEPPSGTKSATAISVTSDVDLGEDSRERTVELPTSLEALLWDVGLDDSAGMSPTIASRRRSVSYDYLEASVKAEELFTLRTTIEEQKKEIEEQKKENSKLQATIDEQDATIDEQNAQLEEAGRSDAANREGIAHLTMQLGAEERRKARYKAQCAEYKTQAEISCAKISKDCAEYKAKYKKVRGKYQAEAREKAAMQAQIESLKERVETEAQGKAEFEAEYIRVRDAFVGYANDMRPIIEKFQENGSHTFDFEG